MLSVSHYRGNLFENFVVSDFVKQFYNVGRRPALYFWRDKNGRIEIDCIIDAGIKLYPIEIKSSQTIAPQYFDNLVEWNEISSTNPSNNYVVYAGDGTQVRSQGTIMGWEKAADLITKLI